MFQLRLPSKSTYISIQKKRYQRRIFSKAQQIFAEKRVALTFADAQKIYQEGAISPGRLSTKIDTWKYVIETYAIAEDAKAFLEKKINYEASGKGYYRQCDRKIYHRETFDFAMHLQSVFKIDLDDAKLLWQCTSDGRGPSKVKYRTLSFVLNEMKLTAEAKEYLEEKVSSSYDRLARRAKRKSGTPLRQWRGRRKQRSTHRRECPNSPLSQQEDILDDFDFGIPPSDDELVIQDSNDVGDASDLNVGNNFEDYDKDISEDRCEKSEAIPTPESNEDATMKSDKTESHEAQTSSFSIMSPLKSYFASWFEAPTSRKRAATDWPSNAKRQRTKSPSQERSDLEEPFLLLDGEDITDPMDDVQFWSESEDQLPEESDTQLKKNAFESTEECEIAKSEIQRELIQVQDLTMPSTPAKTNSASSGLSKIEEVEEGSVVRAEFEKTKSTVSLAMDAERVSNLDSALAKLEAASVAEDTRDAPWFYTLPSIGQCVHCDAETKSIYTSDDSGIVYKFSDEGELLKKLQFESPVVAIFRDDADTFFIDEEQNVFSTCTAKKSVSDLIAYKFCLNLPDCIQSASGYQGKIAVSTTEGTVAVIDIATKATLWTSSTQKDGHGFFISAEPDGIFHAAGNILCKYDWTGEILWKYEAEHNILDACMNKMHVYTSHGMRIDRFTGEASWHVQPEAGFNLQASYAVSESIGDIFYEHYEHGILQVKQGGGASPFEALEKRPIHLAFANDKTLIAISSVIQTFDLEKINVKTKPCKTSDVELLMVNTEH